MRQNSCPTPNRITPSPRPLVGLATHPLGVHSHIAESRSHTIESHSHTTESHTRENNVVSDVIAEDSTAAIEESSPTITTTVPHSVPESTAVPESSPPSVSTECHITVQSADVSPPLTPMSPVIIVSEGGILDNMDTQESSTDNTDTPPPHFTTTLTLSLSTAAPPNASLPASSANNRLDIPSNALVRMDSVDDSMKDHPGFLFLTRNDFYEFVKVRTYHSF